MKFAVLALLGAVNASEELEFLKSIEEENTELFPLGSGKCINYKNDFSEFYDLKGFDAFGRDQKKHTPTGVEIDGKYDFYFKACQPAWSMTQANLDSLTTKLPGNVWADATWAQSKKSNGFLVDATGAPLYTFGDAQIETLKQAADVKVPVQGWTITYTSKEKTCGDAKEAFVITMTGTCDETATTKSTLVAAAGGTTTCAAKVDFVGKEACPTEIPIQKALGALGPFYGVILLVVGSLMCFAGRKFVFIVLGSVIGFVAFAVLFGLSYALFLPVDISTGLLAGVIFVCALIGGALSYGTFKFTKAYTVQILAGVAGAVIFVMLGKMAKLHKAYFTYIFAIIGAAVGVFLGTKFNKVVKSGATALIGSYLMVWGVGQYAPGYPGNLNIKTVAKNPNANMEAIGYLAGFVILAIAGFIIQMRNFRQKDEEENADDGFLG